MNLILRDIFPFLFMMMPLLLYRLYEEEPGFFQICVWGALIIGSVFSVRALADITGSVLGAFLRLETGELAYFANAPTLLFTALIIFGLGVHYFTRDFTVRSFCFLCSERWRQGLCSFQL